jgi:hypothetical protein
MAGTRRAKWWVVGTVAILGTFLLAQTAFGASQPADKAYASGKKVAIVGPGANVPILTAVFKTSAPEDLIFNVTLECSIVTSVTTTGNGFAEAQGNVQIWVTIDGKIVPIQSVSSNPQPSNSSIAGDDTDKVTFCHRDQAQTVSGATNTFMLTEYIETKEANAFNWVYLNAGSLTHTITVYATLTNSPVTAACTPTTVTTCSAALIGNRTLVVEPTKLANNAVIS